MTYPIKAISLSKVQVYTIRLKTPGEGREDNCREDSQICDCGFPVTKTLLLLDDNTFKGELHYV